MKCDRKFQYILGLILCLVILRGLIYGMLIPFDQTPDEYHHFKLIKAKQLQLGHSSDEERCLAAAQIEATRKYLLYPTSRAGEYKIQDFTGIILPEPPSSLRFYYLSTAWILRILSLENVRDEIYAVRAFSLLCGTLVVLFSFFVTREVFPENLFMVIGVPLFIALIPQFSAMNGSINNDKLAEVFVSFMFWIIVKSFKYGLHKKYLVLYFGVTVLALLSKRTSIFLIPLFIVFIFVYFWKSSLGIQMHVVFLGVVLTLLITGYYLGDHVSSIRYFIGKYVIWAVPHEVKYFILHESYSLEMLKLYAKFFTVVYWSFWAVFGYMTIHLHHFWYMITAFGQMIAICGLVKSIILVKLRKQVLEKWKVKVLYVFASSIFLALVIMFLRSIIFRPDDPILTQGRYLFTVIIPISILTLFGIMNVFPARYHRVIGIIGILGLVMLDAVCLSNYILLNFHSMALGVR